MILVITIKGYPVLWLHYLFFINYVINDTFLALLSLSHLLFMYLYLPPSFCLSLSLPLCSLLLIASLSAPLFLCLFLCASIFLDPFLLPVSLPLCTYLLVKFFSLCLQPTLISFSYALFREY